ncbi:MAG TPA: trehalose-6-phosphate synthase, partial [Polyangiaceae bacterium]|nr:trehalose-6-phosphate synthase [Polyangiaceae bacterium]
GRDEKGQWAARPGEGGLVTALAPVLRNRGGVWIGWPGTDDREALDKVKATSAQAGYQLLPVPLTAEDEKGYYHGFSNETIWPLFHDLVGHCRFEPAHWRKYQEVNQRFARTVLETTTQEDYVWVQDYHLMCLGSMLREKGVKRRLGFFLHIPFPAVDIFSKLPWRKQILEALLAYDLIGFQTARDRRNFIQCVRSLLQGVQHVGRGYLGAIRVGERQVLVGHFPIGIDAKRFASEAASAPVAEQAWYIHELLPKRQIVLGIDRLDYTKGIPERLRAVGNALERFPELHRQLTFVQVVVPSRVNVGDYRQQRRTIEQLVGKINGKFTTAGWTPVHYIYRALSWHELLAYYRTSEIALLTPLKDGMNLIAKEYCVCSVESGVLILSEFAGAARQLQGALLVNPNDIEATADALRQAFHMPAAERKRRIRKLQREVDRHDVFWWVDLFLNAAFGRRLADFPLA